MTMKQDRYNANFPIYSNSFKGPVSLAILVESMHRIKVKKIKHIL